MNYETSTADYLSTSIQTSNYCCEQPARVETADGYDTEKVKRFFGIGENEGDQAGVKVTPMMALTQPSVWRCINKIAETVASVPLHVHKNKAEGGSEVDKTHAAYRLLRRKPNTLQNAFDWKRQVMFHVLLFGNHVSWIKRNRDGIPIEIIPLNPSSTGLVVTDDGRRMYATRIKGWDHNRAKGSDRGIRYVFPDNVIHVKGLSMDGLWGLPVIEQLAGTAGVAIAARRFAARFFGKGAKPSGVLKLPASMDEEEVTEFIGDFRKQYETLDNSQKVLVLNDPEIELELFQYNNEQSQFNSVRVFEDRQVATFFGFPPSTVGVEDANSYNSLEMAQQAELNAIEPHFCNIEYEVDEKLFTSDQRNNETHEAKFRREALKRVDHKTMVEAAIMELNNGGLTENEYRALRDRPSVDDGDRLRKPKNIGYTDEVDNPVDPAGQVPETPPTEPPPENTGKENQKLAMSVLQDITRREVYRVLSRAEKAVKTPAGFCEFVDTKIVELKVEFRENVSTAATLANVGDFTLTSSFFGSLHRELENVMNKTGLTQEQAHREALDVLESYRGNGYVTRIIRKSENGLSE